MARIKVLLSDPREEDVEEARTILAMNRINNPIFGDLYRHSRDQKIEYDTVVVGDAQHVERDVMGTCIGVTSIAKLKDVVLDDFGRIALRGQGKEAVEPKPVEKAGGRAAPAKPEPKAESKVEAKAEPKAEAAAAKDDDGPSRSDLFLKARELGADVKVTMTNEALQEAIAKAERGSRHHGARG